MTEPVHATDWLGNGIVAWLEHADDRGIFITDARLVIRSWNRWLTVHTGRPDSDVIGGALYTLYPDLILRGFDRYYADALAGEPRLLSERFHRYLFPIRRAVGGDLHEMAQSVRIEPLRVDGVVVGTVTVIQDVTDRVMTERELRSRIMAAEHARVVAEQAAHLKDEFLLTLSHEIRTPLNTVVGWARVLRGRSADRTQQQALDAIERNGLKQIRIVDDLLAMSKLISGRLRLSVEPTDVAAVVREAVAAVTPAADAKRIALQVTIDPETPTMSADPLRLQQALWTLLSNAVKFTPAGGFVEVTVSCRERRLTISVRDDGVGVAPEFLPHMFDLFRQADGSPTRREGGLGLGLALARRIVELHGGEIGVESEGRNCGALFWIELPVTRTAPAAATRTPRPPAVTTLAGITVLVVDPDRDARELTAALLRDYGATVWSVVGSREAIDAVAAGDATPDVLLVDVEDQPGEAYALLRAVRQHPAVQRRTLRGIAVGSHTDAQQRIRALAGGYEHHLTKPLEPALLAATVAAAASGA